MTSFYGTGDSFIIDTGTGTGSIYLHGTRVSSSVVTPAGNEVIVKANPPSNKDDGVSVRLFFKLVHSKLLPIEKEKLTFRLLRLQKIVNSSKDLGQQALYEKLTEMMAIAVRELEVAAVGCDKYVDVATVSKFRNVRKEQGNQIVFFEKWEKFPRLPPPHVEDKLKKLMSLSLFDEYWVLYLDYARKEELKTNKDKIREKDPILFGKFVYQPDRLYFIADWVDDYCDLTLEQFVQSIRKEDLSYKPGELTVDSDNFERIKKEVMERHARLKATNSSNFRNLMAEEDKANAAPKKVSWFTKLLSFFRK